MAVVVAETYAEAEAAAELIEIDYKELPAVVAMERPSSRASHCCSRPPPTISASTGTWATRRRSSCFARAHHVTRLELVNNRLVSNPMEPRAAIGDYDPATEDYTLYTTSQAPHVHRLLIGPMVLQLPEHKLRVVAPCRRRLRHQGLDLQ